MKQLDLGQSIGVIANVGVIAGIVFLALEIRQNTAMIEAQMSQGRAETAMSQAESLYNSEYLPEIFVAIEQGLELTDPQRVRFNAYLRAFNRNQDNILRQYHEGMLGENTLRSVRDAVRVELAEKALARELWESTKVSYTEPYVELVDGVIAEYLSQRPQ